MSRARAPISGDMVSWVRFDQVKFIVRDIESLIAFYVETLQCSVVWGPAKLEDPVLNTAIGVSREALVTLAMLALPGQAQDGLILELYKLEGAGVAWRHSPGQGHIAFEVEDVDDVVAGVMEAGGATLGEIVDWEAPSGNRARFVYMLDPEGNIIDLWGRIDRVSEIG